ncbi:hypothetical protein ABKN59_002744 [Abortiporus biennis]
MECYARLVWKPALVESFTMRPAVLHDLFQVRRVNQTAAKTILNNLPVKMNVDAHTQILAAATFLPQHIPHLPLSPAVWHSMPSFTQRKGSGYIFHQPSSVQGYLSQINQWARTIFEWDIQEIKPDHTNPDGSTKKYFIAIPIFNEETLYEFQATGYTVKSAKEAASECMVKRDFCNKASSKLYVFYPPSSFEGYLAQIHKWARTVSLTWDCQEIKPDHTTDGPTKRYFIATPIFLEERLHLFADKGKTKQAAKEAASKLMAESGYC